LRLAAALIDIGDTSIGQGEEGQTLPQMLHSGIGVTFHTRQDAFHLALDFRDVLNAHHEEPFKRVYAGVKLLLRTYVGLGFGVYHGSPSFGAEIDLIFLRVAASVYTREYGHRPGIDPRPVAMVSIATGFDF
jgi:hypothetical protein